MISITKKYTIFIRKIYMGYKPDIQNKLFYSRTWLLSSIGILQ